MPLIYFLHTLSTLKNCKKNIPVQDEATQKNAPVSVTSQFQVIHYMSLQLSNFNRRFFLKEHGIRITIQKQPTPSARQNHQHHLARLADRDCHLWSCPSPEATGTTGGNNPA
jgi:hypothetical protein